MNISITGTGSYIPSIVQKNEKFENHHFLNDDGSIFESDNTVIIEKFKAITGIEERKYAKTHQNNSDIAFLAAERAIENAKVDPETLDYIIVAHNFGDVKHDSIQTDMLPSIASRVKYLLQIENPKCVAYDLIFGCPGWVEGMIQAQAFIKAGMAKKCLVIGSETLSRVVDPHDRDSMIFSDGAGATILEATENGGTILAHESASFTKDETYYLYFGSSNNKELDQNTRYIKMFGRKIYEFAVINVPKAMKSCLEKSGVDIKEIKKIFIHQANEKMDEAIINRFYKQYKMTPPDDVMPMNIQKMGNSSVATVPTLLDMVRHNNMENHELNPGDVVIFASVGAGMNINAIVYRY